MVTFQKDGSLTITQGDSVTFQVNLYLDKLKTQPRDLTNFGVRFAAAKSYSSEAVLVLLLGSGVNITGDGNNIINVSMTPQQTKLIPAKDYVYDLEIFSYPITNGLGVITGYAFNETLIGGATLTVKPQVK